jgi:hypothetical protein
MKLTLSPNMDSRWTVASGRLKKNSRMTNHNIFMNSISN